MAETDVVEAGQEQQVAALLEPVGGEMESLKLKYWEKRLIAEALRRSGGNVPDAASLLGIGRATLYYKVKQYGLVPAEMETRPT